LSPDDLIFFSYKSSLFFIHHFHVRVTKSKPFEEIDMENKFTLGDAIIVALHAPHRFFPGESASVSNFYKITSEEGAKEFQCNVGDWIYTVEFSDGSDLQIAEHYLEKYDDRTN
jgi:hypothetical protein